MKRIFIVLSLVGVLKTGLYAQSLSLEQARLMALASSRSLARYELSISNSVLNEKNQFYSTLPQVSAGYSISADFLRNWEFVNPVDTFRAGVNFSLSQIIFNGGRNSIQKAIRSIATENERQGALAEYFNVLDSVDNAYYAVLEAAATLEAEEASLEAAAFSLAIADVRQANGIISYGDYIRALADKEARENSRNQARRSLALSETRLRTLLGITNNFELEQIDLSIYEDALVRLASVSDEEADALLAQFWNLLIASNPSLSRTALGSRQAELNLSSAWRDLSPTISASVSGGYGYSSANGFDPSGGTASLSITGSIPIDFWVFNNNLERSKNSRDSASLSYTDTVISLQTELQSVLFSVLAQAAAVLSSRRSFEYMERHFEYVMERYRLSQSSVSELSEASSLFINSRNSQIRARYAFLQSLSRLRSLCALGDEEKLIQLLLGN